MEIDVEILVKLQDLEIIDVKGEIHRTHEKACVGQSDALRKVIGVRVGPGMLKIIKGLVGEETTCGQLAFMIEECCHGVILTFTKETLVSSPRPREKEEALAFYREMIKDNIRLYNRCAAFAPGSSMVEGIEPPT
jgi:hypothetical protein